MINPKLQDKVVLITGANHGIGAATAKAFADQGAKVFITFYRELTDYNQQALEQAKAAGIGSDALYYARQQQDADWLVQAIGAAGGTAVAHEMDLADPANILRLFDRCESSLGPVDVLVNNHTFCVLETFDPAQVSTEQGEERFISAAMIDRHFAINTRAYALLMAEYAQRSIKRAAGWDRIINISTDAVHAHPWNVSYGEHGLGRAILSETVRRLYAKGAAHIVVETDNYRDAAFALYEAVGFRVQHNVLVFRKDYPSQTGAARA